MMTKFYFAKCKNSFLEHRACWICKNDLVIGTKVNVFLGNDVYTLGVVEAVEEDKYGFWITTCDDEYRINYLEE